jgi:hypothetical protein
VRGQEEPKYLITPHDIEITYKPTKVDPIKVAKLEERKRTRMESDETRLYGM